MAELSPDVIGVIVAASASSALAINKLIQVVARKNGNGNGNGVPAWRLAQESRDAIHERISKLESLMQAEHKEIQKAISELHRIGERSRQ